jgi:hypothetical protein
VDVRDLDRDIVVDERVVPADGTTIFDATPREATEIERASRFVVAPVSDVSCESGQRLIAADRERRQRRVRRVLGRHLDHLVVPDDRFDGSDFASTHRRDVVEALL